MLYEIRFTTETRHEVLARNYPFNGSEPVKMNIHDYIQSLKDEKYEIHGKYHNDEISEISAHKPIKKV